MEDLSYSIVRFINPIVADVGPAWVEEVPCRLTSVLNDFPLWEIIQWKDYGYKVVDLLYRTSQAISSEDDAALLALVDEFSDPERADLIKRTLKRCEFNDRERSVRNEVDFLYAYIRELHDIIAQRDS